MRRKMREERAATPSAGEGGGGPEIEDEVGSNITATQTCKQIDRHARAMYGIAARGDGGGYAERDGYNLITFNRKDLLAWGGDHVWKVGDTDMTKLPEAVTSVRHVAHWRCVNTSVDGDLVVFKRSSPCMYRRFKPFRFEKSHVIF